MANSETLILWDVGAVQLNLNYKSLMNQAVERLQIPIEELAPKFSAIEQKALKGEYDKIGYLEAIRTTFKLTGSMIGDEGLTSLLSSVWPSQITPVVKLKLDLMQKGYPTGNFSNMTDFCFQETQVFPDVYKVSQPNLRFYSFQTGVIKPDEKMFEKVPKTFKQVVYIDDNPLFIKRAVKMGWKGILYTGSIDRAEPDRITQGYVAIVKPSANIQIAENPKQLKSSLEIFGLKFD